MRRLLYCVGISFDAALPKGHPNVLTMCIGRHAAGGRKRNELRFVRNKAIEAVVPTTGGGVYG